MPQNPFKQNKDFEQKPNRNAFDLSHSNHFTGNFGTLIPVLCEPVIPGDHFNIQSALALRAMPLPFPVQTKCKAYVHFFYQRNKNLWKNWQDFIYQNKPSIDPLKVPSSGVPRGSVVPPYILHSASNQSMFNTGSIGDYLGIPTINNSGTFYRNGTIVDGFGNNKLTDGTFFTLLAGSGTGYPLIFDGSYISDANDLLSGLNGKSLTTSLEKVNISAGTRYYTAIPFNCGSRDSLHLRSGMKFTMSFEDVWGMDTHLPIYALLSFGASDSFTSCVKCSLQHNIEDGEVIISGSFSDNLSVSGSERMGTIFVTIVAPFVNHPSTLSEYSNFCEFRTYDKGTSSYGFVFSKQPINALPFRCYESIYNSFYRDARNNPFYVNGVQENNKFVSNDGDGKDEFVYSLFNRNWELDQFTSCVMSPQQGVAPLVGFSNNGDLVYQNDDGSESVIAKLDEVGDNITSAEVKSAIKTLAVNLTSLASSGISINDFRNVNAYQRWKETNIRRGLKYKDQIKARWGIDLKESLLDMPEFIGGFSCDIDVNTVSSTTETENLALGSYAGQMSAFGRADNSTNVFCDDYGYIMGIISIVPTPVYTSTTRKDFFKFSPLDYFSPEFSQIGMQPVPYKELVSVDSLSNDYGDETFGYQRPWYEYLNHVDEAHGLFRTDFQNFILNREFDSRPFLGPEFTTIKSSDLNNIFITDYGDKFLGQIYFKITAKRPIPKVSVPSIS